MSKKRVSILLAALGLGLAALACSNLPLARVDQSPPSETIILPSSTWTPEPFTPTLAPPTPTPAPPVIGAENLSGLRKIHNFQAPDDSFRTVAFSPDSLYLASGTGSNQVSVDQKLRIWDVISGQLIAESEKLNTIIWEIRYSPDGKTLAAGLDNNTIQLRSAENLALVSVFHMPGAVNSLSFSPDGTRLAAGVATGDGGQVIVLDLQTGQHLLQYWAHAYSIPSLDFSPDGYWIATGAVDRYVKIWDSYTGGLVQTLSQGSQGGAIRFSPDGSILASGHCEEFVGYDCLKGMVLLWSSGSWDIYRSLVGPLGRVQGVGFSPDMTLLIGSSDEGYLNIWRISDGQLIYRGEGNYAGLETLSVSADGRYFATGSQDTASIWGIVP